MPVNSCDVWVLYTQELRSALRERNIVIYSILLPLLLYPVMLWLMFSGLTFVRGQTEGFVSRVAVRGLPPEHDGFRSKLEADSRIELVDEPSSPEQATKDIRSGSLDAFADFSTNAGAPAAPGVLDAPNFRLNLAYDESKERSAAAKQRVSALFDEYRREWLAREAGHLGLGPTEWQQFHVTQIDTASGREIGAFLLKLLLPAILIVMISLGCFYPAIDATAGERERSTWETTMTLAASRESVVTAKYLYVATFGIAAGLLNLTAMMLSMGSIISALGVGAKGIAFLLPASAVPVIAVGAVLLALFISAGMMIFASFARTFKEGQTMVSPFYMFTILPVMFLQTPDLEFTPKLALIPVVNVAMMFRDAIGGTYQWPLIALTVAIEGLTIVLLLMIARRILAFEDVLMGSYSGSFIKFLKERMLARRGTAPQVK